MGLRQCLISGSPAFETITCPRGDGDGTRNDYRDLADTMHGFLLRTPRPGWGGPFRSDLPLRIGVGNAPVTYQFSNPRFDGICWE